VNAPVNVTRNLPPDCQYAVSQSHPQQASQQQFADHASCPALEKSSRPPLNMSGMD